jgi:hypothetical protein
MQKKQVVLAAVCCLFLLSPAFAADEWLTLPRDEAQLFGKLLTGIFAKVKDQQIKVEPMPSESLGLIFADGGIIFVPSKHFDELEAGKHVESETGVPLGYLFLSPRFNPLEKGEMIDPQRLRTIQYEDEGRAKNVTALIVAVRNVKKDDRHLYVYGSDKKPLFDIKFFEADDELDNNIAIRVQDVADGKGTLVITVLKKYEASIEIEQ